ncbi:MAG: hypothetical protein IKE52_00180 [Mogibacterium sp.]|nr:hypothetical protein [Mogibacterium sp.]
MEESANTTAPANSTYNGTETTDKNGTKTYAPGAEYKVESDAAVKVLWKSTVHTVTYVVANGT